MGERAYYNEFDPYAAQWLRNLIAAGHIAPGDVDERSIVDVQPEDLSGYTQCHFFAGVGGWSLAARLAGFPDDRELWTGSCPCQPFSVAGKGEGQADERHLWPVFFGLIRARRPAVVMGEQVAAAVGKDWLDGVSADLEGIGYACGAVVIPACAVDAPHRRDRLWFVADAAGADQRGHAGNARSSAGPRRCEAWQTDGDAPSSPCHARRSRHPDSGSVADADSIGGQVDPHTRRSESGDSAREIAGSGGACDVALANAHGSRSPARIPAPNGRCEGEPEIALHGSNRRPGPWGECDWITGADGKARRVEPGIRLLAHGVPARVGKLRAYGNAIVPQVAAEVIAAYLDAERIAA